MITEDYVSFETAKLLKEKGFDEKCLKKYYGDDKSGPGFNYQDAYDGGGIYDDGLNNSELYDSHVHDEYQDIASPTLQMAMKWLREVHHIGIESLIVFNDENDGRPQFMCQYWSLVPPFDLKVDEAIESRCFDTYEESIETAIKYCLENLI